MTSGFTLGKTIRKRMALPPLLSRSLSILPQFYRLSNSHVGRSLLTVQLGCTTMNLSLVVANQLARYFFARNEEEMNSITPDQAVAPYVAPYTAIGVSTVAYTVSERRQIS